MLGGDVSEHLLCLCCNNVCLPFALIVSQIKPVVWQNALINGDVKKYLKAIVSCQENT